MPSDSIDRLIVAGLAETIAAAGLGSWDDFGRAPLPTGSPRPIYAGPDLSAYAADECLVLTPTAMSYDGPRVGAQVNLRFRGNPDQPDRYGLDAWAQAVHDLLHPGGRPLVPPGGRLGPLRNVGRISPFGDTLPLSRDTARRFGRSANIRLRLRWTGTPSA